MIRYDLQSKKPVQGVVITNELGEFDQVYENLSDPLIKEYLECRSAIGYSSPAFKWNFGRILETLNPLQSNLSQAEFLPTNAYQLLKILAQYFPRHQMIFSDFHTLPDTIPGIDAPVVQSMYKNNMIPCQTFLVKLGLFDIFFPTNFYLFGGIYKQLTGKEFETLLHRDFLIQNGEIGPTTTKSGENPMLEYYENASFITTKL